MEQFSTEDGDTYAAARQIRAGFPGGDAESPREDPEPEYEPWPGSGVVVQNVTAAGSVNMSAGDMVVNVRGRD